MFCLIATNPKIWHIEIHDRKFIYFTPGALLAVHEFLPVPTSYSSGVSLVLDQLFRRSQL
jgi:hypothetical protein